MIRQLLIYFVSITACCALHAQSYLQLDKSFYVTGEVIYFSAFTPEEFTENTTFHCALVDPNHKITKEFYVKNSANGMIDGYIKVPFDIASDYYSLNIYAFEKSSKKRVPFLSVNIPIYNDLNFKASGYNEVANQTMLDKGALKIDIQHAEKISAGDNASIKVNVMDSDGSPIKGMASISIKKASTEILPSIFEDKRMVANAEYEDQMMMTGQLRDRKGETLETSVLGLYSPAEKKFHYTKSYTDGDLRVVLPDFYGERQMQFLGFQFQEDYYVNAALQDTLHGPTTADLPFNKSIENYLENSRKRKKVYQYFGSLEYNINPEDIRIKAQELDPQFTYKFQEYQPFENVGAFFNELITPLKFDLGKDSIYTSYVENPTKFSQKYSLNRSIRLEGDPLFIVDGYTTRDADFVGKLDYNIIDEVQLFFRPEELKKQFNAMGRSGVVIITTNQDNINIPKGDKQNAYTFSGLLPKLTTETTEELKNGQPDFRANVYWNGQAEITKQGMQIDFKQSDDVGEFIIEVSVKSDSGVWSYATSRYISAYNH